jgi:hypothetical protein
LDIAVAHIIALAKEEEEVEAEKPEESA